MHDISSESPLQRTPILHRKLKNELNPIWLSLLLLKFKYFALEAAVFVKNEVKLLKNCSFLGIKRFSKKVLKI